MATSSRQDQLSQAEMQEEKSRLEKELQQLISAGREKGYLLFQNKALKIVRIPVQW